MNKKLVAYLQDIDGQNRRGLSLFVKNIKELVRLEQKLLDVKGRQKIWFGSKVGSKCLFKLKVTFAHPVQFYLWKAL